MKDIFAEHPFHPHFPMHTEELHQCSQKIPALELLVTSVWHQPYSGPLILHSESKQSIANVGLALVLLPTHTALAQGSYNT